MNKQSYKKPKIKMITEIKNKIAMTSQNCLPPHDDLKIIFSQKKYFFVPFSGPTLPSDSR